MADPEVRILDPDEPGFWPDDLILSAGFSATAAWSGYIKEVYKIPVYRLEAHQNKQVTGLLVLFWIRHPLFGNYLTTAPFASYGGFSFSTAQARDALLERAKRLSRDLDADYVIVRFYAGEDDPPPSWRSHPIYATYLVGLASEPEVLLSFYSSNHRNHVRKSQNRGFLIRFGHLELLDPVYDVLARSMQELGSPYHGKKYLSAMAESLGGKLEFAVVFDRSGSPVGSGVFIFHGQVVTNLHANILRKYRSGYAGEFLYWSLIKRYGQQGFKTFDLGRSLVGSGNETFKMKWHPDKKNLAYWYFLPPGKSLPDLNQKNPKFQLAIAVWKHLPFPVVRFLGPSLIRGLA